MKYIGILTSGGDAPGMNAVIWSAVRSAEARGMKVLGIYDGYQGLIDGNVHEITSESIGNCLDYGGTILSTARCSAMMKDEGRDKAAETARSLGIEGIIVCGGDGSYHGAMELYKRQIPTIGVPGTIDNDLAYTDFTIGYDTACNTALNAVMNIRDTMTSHHRYAVVEVMGRHCGDIAISVGLAAGADAILIPEDKYPEAFDMTNLSARLKEIAKSRKTGLVVMAEGVEYDMPNHADVLAKELTKRTGLEIRASVLAHMQRGGRPTITDRSLAIRMADKAVDLLDQGIGNRVIGIKENKIFDMDILEALACERVVNWDSYRLSGKLAGGIVK